MVYTPSALTLASAMRAETGYRDDPRGLHGMRAQPARAMIACETQYLRPEGSAGRARHSVPRIPAFMEAFTAFARGTLITTTGGPVAVEDLTPGMRLVTNERGPSPLLWVGTMTVRADACAQHGSGPRIVRVMPDALGMGRPMADFMAGPGARVMRRTPGMLDETLRPVADLIDGVHAIELRPPTAVQFYHIALRRHATITAAGLSVETFHPGPGFDQALSRSDLALFLELFPHISKPLDFGSLAHPRKPLRRRGGT